MKAKLTTLLTACACLIGCRRAVQVADFDAPPVYRFGERLEYARPEEVWLRLRLAAPEAERFLEEGWADEPADVDGVPGRWITQSRAGVRFVTFDTDNVELEIRLKPYTRSYRAQKLRLFVNGVMAGSVPLKKGVQQTVRFSLPPKALRHGSNTLKLKFSYASRRHGRAAAVESMALSGISPYDAGADHTASASGWEQAPDSVVRWRLVVPRRGYLRFHAVPAKEDTRCRVRLIDGMNSTELFNGSPRLEPEEVSLAAFGGMRAELEFTAVGGGAVNWKVCEVGGRIDPADVNVYLVAIDSLRADHTGIMGRKGDVTPFLDQLAGRGVLFSRTWAVSNESLPSFASILTGRYPQSHGLIKNGRDIDRQQWSLSGLLGKKGFRTAVYANFGILTWGSTTGKDFEKRRPVLGTPGKLDMSDTQGNVFAAALNWATVMWREKQFLWLHSQFLHMDPLPEDCTAPFMQRLKEVYGEQAVDEAAERMQKIGFKKVSQDYTAGRIELADVELDYWRAHYDAGVRFSDDHVRAFWEGLKRSGLDPFALTIIVSDHGTSIGELHRLLHTGPPYSHLLHVPLLLVLPGYEEWNGTVVDSLTETVDIAPTVMDYLGFGIPRRMQGESLIPVIEGDRSETRDFCYAMVGRRPATHYYAVRNDEWAFWSNFSGKSGLECLRSGSNSVECVSDKYPEQTGLMKKELAKWISRTVDVSIDADDELSEEVRAILVKAGYLEDRE